MIFLQKPSDPPVILKDNAEKWTEALHSSIVKYGSYNKIPNEEREKLLTHYRHPDIKEKLFRVSEDKCAFCEAKPGESGNIEVEHFFPKSIYYNETFKWENFLPVCRKCNEAKGDLDTKNEPIINPSTVDPEEYFEFDSLFMVEKPSCPNKDMAERTIRELKLNSRRLFAARSELLTNLSSYIVDLQNWLEEIEEADTDRKKRIRLLKLRDSIENIEALTLSKVKFSAYTKSFLESNNIYLQAKELLEKEL